MEGAKAQAQEKQEAEADIQTAMRSPLFRYRAP